MDGSGGYALLLRHLPGRTLAVDFSADRHNRVPHADAAVEAAAADRWAAASAANPTLFNGLKFRLAGVRAGAPKETVLEVGLTDYAAFVGTHGAERCIDVFGRAGLSLAFGNAMFAETDDGFVPFLVRGENVGEGRGFAVLPGGHPEPGEVAGGVLDDASVAREVMEAGARELVEELFVPAAALRGVEVLGLLEREKDLKPILCFSVRVRMTQEEVERCYAAGNGECEESVRLVMVSVKDVESLFARGTLDSGEVIMPDHMGCLDLAVQYLTWRRHESAFRQEET